MPGTKLRFAGHLPCRLVNVPTKTFQLLFNENVYTSTARNTVELYLSGIMWTPKHPDMQKIRITGFFFENRLHWHFEVRLLLFTVCTVPASKSSQWPRGLRLTSTAARLLRSWVRFPPGTRMFLVSVDRYRSLRRADHSSRGVLPTVVCLSVI